MNDNKTLHRIIQSDRKTLEITAMPRRSARATAESRLMPWTVDPVPGDAYGERRTTLQLVKWFNFPESSVGTVDEFTYPDLPNIDTEIKTFNCSDRIISCSKRKLPQVCDEVGFWFGQQVERVGIHENQVLPDALWNVRRILKENHRIGLEGLGQIEKFAPDLYKTLLTHLAPSSALPNQPSDTQKSPRGCRFVVLQNPQHGWLPLDRELLVSSTDFVVCNMRNTKLRVNTKFFDEGGNWSVAFERAHDGLETLASAINPPGSI